MKRIRILSLFLCAVSTVCAQRSFVISNSDDGQSTLSVFLPTAEKATGRAVLCCPGGGYGHVCMDYEGTDLAPYFNDMGIAYAVLKYRMPHGDRNIPINDAKRAMTMLRDSAIVWNINPYDVGIMGFSAGGHLASTIATHAKSNARPDFQILFYPVISMDKSKGHRGSSENFLGNDVDDAKLIREYSNDQQVRKHITPPAIIFMADDDKVVPPLTNGVPYYIALRKNHVSAALHVYPRGGHGWRPERFPYFSDMQNSLREWLSQLPAPKADAKRVACIGNSITEGSGIDLSEWNGYPARLQNLLGNGFYVRNYGLGARTLVSTGDRPYMDEWAWEDCILFNPDIAIIKLGTNDTKKSNWNAPQYEKDLQVMIDHLKALPACPRILLGYPAKAWKDSWTINENTIVQEVIPIIDKVAKKNKLEVIDFHTPLSADANLFVADGIHPNEKGAQIMAETAYEKLK